MMHAMLRILLLGLWVSIALADEMQSTAPQSLTHFVVIGDMPYTESEYTLLEQPDGAIAKAIKTLAPPVLIHLGDFKRGLMSCSDELLRDHYRQIAFLNPHKTVYTPGDNEWTDCDRLTLSGRYDELERLNFLRELFFHQDNHQLSKSVPGLIRQDGFIENALWKIDQVVFATLHIPGTNNGRREILSSNIEDALNEADRRDRFNAEWLQKILQQAESAQAIVLAFHADILYFDHEKPACTHDNRTACDGYKNIRDSIKTMVQKFGKPVLLIHGDTQAYCLHQPYYEIHNLWRLNAPGDAKYIDAAQVTFDTGNATIPFAVTSLLDRKPAPAICNDNLIDLPIPMPLSMDTHR